MAETVQPANTGAKGSRKEKRTVDEILNKRNNHALSVRGLVTETCTSYLFWSVFQGIGPMIWFYPLNELDITGYEAFIVVLFAPLITAIPGVLSLIQNRWVLGALRVIALLSTASFQAPDTLSRLIILAVGAAAHILVFTATLWSSNFKCRLQAYWGLILGLFLFISSRIWYFSFIPTWWSQQTNTVIITVGAIATLEKLVSDGEVVTDDSYDPRTQTQVRYLHQPRCYTQIHKSHFSERARANSFSSITTGMACGSLLYLTQACYGEVSVVTRWVGQGYPNHGPGPVMWGALVLVCIYVGISISWLWLGSSVAWWLIGCLSAAALYYLPSWQGYTGGLILALYTMSIWPDLIDRLVHCPPARVMSITVLTYLVGIFFSVWTVAYNFVPGGTVTRERTDVLMAVIMLTFSLALFSGKRLHPCSFTDIKQKLVQNSAFTIKAMFVGIFVFGFLGFVHRCDPTVHQHPPKREPREFTAAIWTYHFGYDNQGWPSLERSAQLLNNTGADFITLLESDASKPFLGNNDLGMWLGEKLGMYVDFGPSTKDHTWGNLILSKYPIIKSQHHLLPSPEGELAPAVTATVNMSGHLVDFVVTHMGNDQDYLDRKLQAQFLANELDDCENPVVFLGYVTSAPFSRDYKHLTEAGRVKDIDDTDRDRWCEYIMYRGLIRLGYARVTHGGLSDTELQMATFRVPSDPQSYTDHNHIETRPSKVDSRLHYSSRFGSYHVGHGYFDTHRFHMSTPKYFVP